MDEKEPATPALSEAELHKYVAADAVLTSTKPWQLVIKSKKLDAIAWILAAIVLAIHIFFAIVVVIGDTGATVTRIDQVGYFLVGVILSVAVFVAIHRVRVRANEDGVEVRNFLGTKFYPWALIYGLNFPEGARLARLELPDFEYVNLWAIQSMDGMAAIQAVEKFRELENKYMPES